MPRPNETSRSRVVAGALEKHKAKKKSDKKKTAKKKNSKKKPPKEQTAASPKEGVSATHSKKISLITRARASLQKGFEADLSWFWEKKAEIITWFLVAFAGVYAAHYLNAHQQRKAHDQAIRQRLSLVYVEAMYNIGYADDILDTYGKEHPPTTISLNISRIGFDAARRVLDDPHFVSFAPTYQHSMLQSYVDQVTFLNLAQQVHLSVLASHGFKSSTNSERARKQVHVCADRVRRMSSVVRDEFKAHFDVNDYDYEKASAIQNRMPPLRE